MSVIDLIKNTLPIVDVLERYTDVQVPQTNRSHFNIRCPYHDDRTPSFTVYTDTGTFRCWSGCNDGRPGDAIDIVKLSRRVDTKEVIQLLIADFGLEKPDGEQLKEWQKKRASREQSAALKKAIHQKVMESMDALKQVEQMARETLANIKTVEDLERVGNLYHLTAQIGYWFDCLVDRSPQVQLEALEEISRFLEKLNMRAGESA